MANTEAVHSSTPPDSYKRHRFPEEIIRHALWLYYRFTLSYRDVEQMLAQRGIMLTYETARYWCQKFGQTVANRVRKQRYGPGDRWPVEEVSLTTGGKRHYLFRAVDQDAGVLDILLQSKRDKKAAKRSFRKLLKRQGYSPRMLVTDKLASYGAAKKEVLSSVGHRSRKRSNNRAGNWHQPTRQRERSMRRFTSAGQAQRFLSTHGPILWFLCPGRHQMPACHYRAVMRQRFAHGDALAGMPIVA